MKPKVMFLCSRVRDRRELSRSHFQNKYDIRLCSYPSQANEMIVSEVYGPISEQFDPQWLTDYFIEQAQEFGADAVVSTNDYPGSLLLPCVAHACNLPSASIESNILCQHKFISRQKQQQFVPEATPKFWKVDNDTIGTLKNELHFPLFAKPIKSNFSTGAHTVRSFEQLQDVICNRQLPQSFFDQFNWFLPKDKEYATTAKQWLVEEFLHGNQCTIEGYVRNGRVNFLGVTDSIMFPNTICFSRFEYPSSLPQSVQDRMADISSRFVRGIGLDNTFFNIECMYNPDTDQLSIIEVNPRMASQFADLYEKVDGFNAYEPCIELALGNKPIMQKRNGMHAVAASLVMRAFKDERVERMPSEKDKQRLYVEFPDARLDLFVKEGDLLSEVSPQDGHSYLIGLVHLGARDQQDLLAKFDYAQRILNIQLF